MAKDFEDLKIWQKAREICSAIEADIKSGSYKDNWRLIDQIRGSSGSAMDNIAEGFERGGNAEFKQFLSIAKASIGESRSQLYRALDNGYITKERFTTLHAECSALGKMLGSFMNYLQRTDLKGPKFKEPLSDYDTQDSILDYPSPEL